MDMNEWILECIGVYNQNGYLDQIAENFGVDLDFEDDTLELIRLGMEGNRPRVGDVIADELFRMVIDRAAVELGLDEDKFDYYTNGALDTDIRYDGEYVTSWEELENIANGLNQE